MISLQSYSKHTSMLLLVIIAVLTVSTIEEKIDINIQTNNQYQQIYRELVKAQNMKFIQQFNADPAHSFDLKPNEFIYLQNEQFHSIYTTNVKINDAASKGQSQFNINSNTQITSPKGLSVDSNISFQPSKCDSVKVDLTIHASRVKQQGKCNSCYSHSTIATIQSMNHAQYGIFFDFSQQQLTECSLSYAPKGLQFGNNQGCNGGYGWKAYTYIQFFGVILEQKSPYTAGTNLQLKSCNQQQIKGQRYKISGFKKYVNYKEPQSQCHILNEVLQQGKTLAVSIYVPEGKQFQFYGSATPGIDIWNICGQYTGVNHQLQLVGSTDKYWKLKNSYGPQWGENGYLYLDKSNGLNCLNICMDFAYPTGVPALPVQSDKN